MHFAKEFQWIHALSFIVLMGSKELLPRNLFSKLYCLNLKYVLKYVLNKLSSVRLYKFEPATVN